MSLSNKEFILNAIRFASLGIGILILRSEHDYGNFIPCIFFGLTIIMTDEIHQLRTDLCLKSLEN